MVYANIIRIIQGAGGNKDHLVKTGIFILDNANMPVLREIRNKYINTEKPPASTLVQVAKLYRDDLLIEIEATAVIPKK
jgi:enamine deaminase RidA (YjgF/YER057c/UK114 family)